jgi:hypothetical protein
MSARSVLEKQDAGHSSPDQAPGLAWLVAFM